MEYVYGTVVSLSDIGGEHEPDMRVDRAPVREVACEVHPIPSTGTSGSALAAATHALTAGHSGCVADILSKSADEMDAHGLQELAAVAMDFNESDALLNILGRAFDHTDVASSFGQRMLVYAADMGDIAVLSMLLRRGVPVEPAELADISEIALVAAAAKNRTECVHRLLKHHHTPCTLQRALYACVTQGNVGNTLRLIYAGAVPDAAAVGWAVMFNHPDCLRALVHNGADVNVMEPDLRSPLYMACVYNSGACARVVASHMNEASRSYFRIHRTFNGAFRRFMLVYLHNPAPCSSPFCVHTLGQPA